MEGQKHKKREKMQPSSVSSLNTSTTSNGSNPGDTVDQTAAPSTSSDPTDTSKSVIKPINKHVINCPLCEVACTGRDAYAAHLRGSKHQKVDRFIY